MSIDSIVNGGLLAAISYLCVLVTQHGPKLERNTAAQERNTEVQANLIQELQATKGYRAVSGFRHSPQSMVAKSGPKR